MTNAQTALAQVREALADPALFDEGASVDDTFRAADNFGAACSPANIAAILAHVEAQEAEIERLRGLLCKCDMKARLVGDGCEFCNPQLADELAQIEQERSE